MPRYGKIQSAMTINMNKKVVFKKRIPEPKEMGREEMRVFEKMSSDNYQRWMIPFVDDISHDYY